MTRCVAVLAAFCLGGCATVPAAAPEEAFFARLRGLCGKAYSGRVVSTDPTDKEMMGKPLVMHVRECSRGAVRIPFHVGSDRSRTWVISRTAAGLRLKHDHRHEDGSEDVLTQYGGDSSGSGTASRQMFPADAFSKTLFAAKGNPASVTNMWAVEVEPGRTFAYELRRPNRHFRVVFDLARPVPAPPPPWGAS